MTEKADPPEHASFDQLRKLHFGGVERDIRDGRHVDPVQLARLVRARGDVGVPDAVIEYMCAHLAGEISPPRGRPSDDPIEERRLDMIIHAEYQRLAHALKEGGLSADDLQKYGPEDNPYEESRTPAERAARLVAALYWDGAESWKTIRNISSKYRRSQE